MAQELCWMSASELAAEIRARRVSPVEVLDAVETQIERVNPRVNAIVTPTPQLAREQAAAAEAAVMHGDELGPLHGVPLTIKDLHLTAGIRTTFGSRLYEDFVPDEDSIIVERLKRAGCVMLGKTNTPEFGLIPLTMNALFGDTLNPWDRRHNAGGSSGGSAAAVACGMGPIATASDGGGSIRVPASFCGVFGIKPHMGRVPHVHFPRGWESLSHQGPLARTVRDAALMLDVTAGPDARDRWSLPATGERFADACTADAGGLRLAWSSDLGTQPVDAEIAEICAAAARRFEQLGCRVDEVAIEADDPSRAHQTIVLCEVAAGMRGHRKQWEAVMYPGYEGMLERAERLTTNDLVEAHWTRDRYWDQLRGVFDRYDALLTPQTSIAAPVNGEFGPREIAGRKVHRLAWLGFCIPFNMTWQPAAALPAGFNAAGLPVGLQLVGRRFDEATLFRLASAYEAAFPWADRKPPVCEG